MSIWIYVRVLAVAPPRPAQARPEILPDVSKAAINTRLLSYWIRQERQPFGQADNAGDRSKSRKRKQAAVSRRSRSTHITLESLTNAV